MHLFSVGDLTLLGKIVSKDFAYCRVGKRNRRCFLERVAAGGGGAAGQTADCFDSGRQFNRISQATWLEAFSRIRSNRLAGLKRRGGWD